MTWKQQVEYLIKIWKEKGTKLTKKGTKSEKSHYSDIQNNKSNDQINPNEKGSKLESSLCKKTTNS